MQRILQVGAGIAWLVLLLVPLAAAWDRSADLAHGWAAPLLMAHLWWERFRGISPRPPSAAPRVLFFAALGLAAFAAGLRLLLEPFPLWPAVLALHTLVVVALGGVVAWRLGGPSLARWLLAPCLILAGVVPWPGIVDRTFIQPLREGLASLSAEILTLFAAPALAQGTSVRLSGGWVGIDEACGGIRSLQAAVMLALFLGEFSRFSLARRAGLLAAALVAALVGNLVRILVLAAVADGGPDSIDAMHDPAGWIALGLTLAGVSLLAWYWHTRAAWSPRTAAASSPRPAAAPLLRQARPASLAWMFAPLTLLLAGELGTRAWFDSAEVRRSESQAWSLRLPKERPGFEVEPLDPAAEEMLRPDHYEAGRWRDEAGERTAAYTVEWHRGQLARTLPFLHNPTVCLPLAGCEMRAALAPEVVRIGSLELPFRRYLFSRAGEEFLVCFVVWDTARAAPLRQPNDAPGLVAWLGTCWTEVAERRRHQPAQIACLAVYGADAEARARQTLASLLQLRTSE